MNFRSRCCLLLLSESLLPCDDLPEKLLHDVGESEHRDSKPAAKKSAHVTEDFAVLRLPGSSLTELECLEFRMINQRIGIDNNFRLSGILTLSASGRASFALFLP
ncbi:hypothetical protein AVEN_208180-1 [Araneus ventricosus]|uniref:Uncharacterized protein n=1 Tax=Araneus ventricosus TaxID=182803 RepID=A0A4Y2U0E0_ARAVE|nr:hypothetical protein AVEN_237185-1 [Araneus ventricosus]GBO05968.1 hypothetical protein AVEN_208180-1 [Araneus ventricosus]